MAGLHVSADNTVSLVLWEGPLPHGMSTHELKQFAVDRYTESMRDEVNHIIEDLMDKHPVDAACGRLRRLVDSLCYEMMHGGGSYAGTRETQG